ncbi:MAG: DUF5671 domain-containing protein [Chloroflexi bacterium]|nr:DUF5671 domain-containing protein [Chloroflexota bacterium]
MGFLGALIPLFIFVGVITAITLLVVRGRSHGEHKAAGITAKQAFFYLFAFAALMVAAAGASVLVSYIVDSLRGGQLVKPSVNQLALGLALIIVGTPAWLLAWRRIVRTVEQDPSEKLDVIRGFYMYVIEAVSLGFLIGGLFSLILVLLQDESLGGTSIAFPVVWGPLWAYHWWVESRLSPEERAATPFRAFYVYGATAVTFSMLLSGSGTIISRLLDEAYSSLLLSDALVKSSLWGSEIKSGIALVLIGGTALWWHFFRGSATDIRSTGRQVYTYLYGILFGVVTVVVTVSIALVVFLQWALSTPNMPPAGEHFRVITGLIPAALAGGVLWSFHNGVLHREAFATSARSARRVYDYLVAGLSLATLGAGFLFLINLFISATVRDAQNYIVDRSGWQGQLAIVLPLLVVGGGIWAYYWRNIQKAAALDPDEVESTSRRLYIYSVFAIAALATLGSLSAALYMFLQDLLDSSLAASTLRDAQWAIAVLLTAGVISGYFWSVIREDRKVTGTHERVEKVTRKYVTILLPAASLDLAAALEARLGYRITVWSGQDEPGFTAPTTTQLEDTVALITAAPTEQVLVIATASGLTVRSYNRA